MALGSGPVPKRESELARPLARRGGEVRKITKGELKPLNLDMFEPDEAWHPKARRIWDAALSSGQVEFWQNSDLAVLYVLCEEWSAYLTSSEYTTKDGEVRRKVNPVMLQSLTSVMSSLLMTEGDRRRVRLELTDPSALEDSNPLGGAKALYAQMMENMELEGE